MKIFALSVFVLMYVLMIAFQSRRVLVVAAAAVIYLVSGILPLSEVPGAINWNVLLMICGTMLLVDYFVESKMPNSIANGLLDFSPNVMWVTILMSLFSGAVSAFVDNVATVLMVAPVGLAVCKSLKINPVPMILSIAVSSNLQGAATLVGDTTSIMLGAYAGMDFLEFIWMEGKPGIFFAVELGALMTVPIMLILFRRDRQPVARVELRQVTDYIPTVALLGVIALLIGVSFIPGKPEMTNGLITMALALLTMLLELLRTSDAGKAKHALASVDWPTLLLLASLFIVIAAVTEAGVIADLSALIVRLGGGSLFRLYTIVVWGSVLISAFVDNIPYVATLLPVLAGVAASMGISPNLLYFGLLSGATLGGNLTPIGASANITAVGMLERQGYKVSFRDFARIGIPFTLTAVFRAYVFLWTVWA